MEIHQYSQDTVKFWRWCQHRQSSCSVHCTAALPVLAGLAVVEGVGTHGTTARILLCAKIYETLFIFTDMHPYFM